MHPHTGSSIECLASFLTNHEYRLLHADHVKTRYWELSGDYWPITSENKIWMYNNKGRTIGKVKGGVRKWPKKYIQAKAFWKNPYSQNISWQKEKHHKKNMYTKWIVKNPCTAETPSSHAHPLHFSNGPPLNKDYNGIIQG